MYDKKIKSPLYYVKMHVVVCPGVGFSAARLQYFLLVSYKFWSLRVMWNVALSTDLHGAFCSKDYMLNISFFIQSKVWMFWSSVKVCLVAVGERVKNHFCIINSSD